MKRKWIIGGCVGAGVLLILAMFPSIVHAQTLNFKETRTNIIKVVRDKIIKNNLVQGGIIDTILTLIFMFFLFLEAFLTGHLTG